MLFCDEPTSVSYPTRFHGIIVKYFYLKTEQFNCMSVTEVSVFARGGIYTCIYTIIIRHLPKGFLTPYYIKKCNKYRNPQKQKIMSVRSNLH